MGSQVTRSNNRTQSGYNSYIQGNTVRKAAPNKQAERQLRRVHRNQAKVRYMNFGYVVFLSIAIFITALTLLGYVKMRSELTMSIKRVATLESQYNDLKLTNDENLARINGSVSLENIKQIAIEELGMTYAKEGQVVVIESEGSDYVRQLRDL